MKAVERIFESSFLVPNPRKTTTDDSCATSCSTTSSYVVPELSYSIITSVVIQIAQLKIGLAIFNLTSRIKVSTQALLHKYRRDWSYGN